MSPGSAAANIAPLAAAQAAPVTQLLAQARGNVPKAVNRLFEVLYHELYRVARGRVREGQIPELSATALVHEAYMRLVQLDELKVSDRQEFFSYAASVMRSIVVDMARARMADSRGGGQADLVLDTVFQENLATPLDHTVLRISEALDHLAAAEPRLAHLVELRYFAGLDVDETAAAMGVSERTVARDWIKARSLLAAILVG